LRGVAKTIGGSAIGLVLVIVVVFFYTGALSQPSAASRQTGAAVSSGGSTVALASTSELAMGVANQYDCALPAFNSGLFCDKLPAGYQIPTKSPYAPVMQCPSGMSSSACNLLKQTAYTGVCTPNETPFTDPFDCGCSGATIADPYLGRCTAPSAICQIGVNQENPQP
jgi:hypothetical protein